MPFAETLNSTSAGPPLRCNQHGGPVLRWFLTMSSIGLSLPQNDSIAFFVICHGAFGSLKQFVSLAFV